MINSNKMKIVKVVPLDKNIFKEELTYFSSQNITEGDVVNIPFRNKNILGLVLSSKDSSSLKSDLKNLNFNLKKINEVKEKSIFSKKYLEAVFLTSKYFAMSEKDLLPFFIPKVFLENYDKFNEIIKKEKIETLIINENNNLKNESLLFQNLMEDRISIYKTLIRASFAKKKSVFIVLPTENDIKEFEKELSKGIESFTYTLYGTLNSKKQYQKIVEILTNEHPVLIIATAQYLAIPREDYEIIILEHENSNLYKNIQNQNLDLRIFVQIYSSKINAKLILGDFLLRFETISLKEMENVAEFRPLSFRSNFEGEIEILNKNTNQNTFANIDLNNKKFSVLNSKSIESIQKTIEKKEKVFIFSLRKGLATMTLCKDCQEILMCKKCSAPIVLYLSKDKQKRMFVCNKCKEQLDPQTICNTCGSWNLMPLGIGTDTLYEEIKKNFPNQNIYQLDKENIKNNKEAEKLINDFYKDEKGILIGTEMAINYLKEKVSLTIISSFDSLWSIPNYKMSEKIIQLILNLSQKTNKKIIIQTRNPEDEILKAFQEENLLSLIRKEMYDRKILGYPPYKRFIKITYTGNKVNTLNAKKIISENLTEYNPLIFSGFIPKQKDKYITNALIKINPDKWSLPEIKTNSTIDKNLLEKLSNFPSDFSIFIDPEDLL